MRNARVGGVEYQARAGSKAARYVLYYVRVCFQVSRGQGDEERARVQQISVCVRVVSRAGTGLPISDIGVKSALYVERATVSRISSLHSQLSIDYSSHHLLKL